MADLDKQDSDEQDSDDESSSDDSDSDEDGSGSEVEESAAADEEKATAEQVGCSTQPAEERLIVGGLAVHDFLGEVTIVKLQASADQPWLKNKSCVLLPNKKGVRKAAVERWVFTDSLSVVAPCKDCDPEVAPAALNTIQLEQDPGTSAIMLEDLLATRNLAVGALAPVPAAVQEACIQR